MLSHVEINKKVSDTVISIFIYDGKREDYAVNSNIDERLQLNSKFRDIIANFFGFFNGWIKQKEEIIENFLKIYYNFFDFFNFFLTLEYWNIKDFYKAKKISNTIRNYLYEILLSDLLLFFFEDNKSQVVLLLDLLFNDWERLLNNKSVVMYIKKNDLYYSKEIKQRFLENLQNYNKIKISWSDDIANIFLDYCDDLEFLIHDYNQSTDDLYFIFILELEKLLKDFYYFLKKNILKIEEISFGLKTWDKFYQPFTQALNFKFSDFLGFQQNIIYDYIYFTFFNNLEQVTRYILKPWNFGNIKIQFVVYLNLI